MPPPLWIELLINRFAGETEDVKTTPKARTINSGKQWIKLVDIDEVKQGASRFEYAKKRVLS